MMTIFRIEENRSDMWTLKISISSNKKINRLIDKNNNSQRIYKWF